jgi:uncharacterized protein (TIGR04255 family)
VDESAEGHFDNPSSVDTEGGRPHPSSDMTDAPRLKNPPVVQVMLTAHFEPALESLTMLDVATIFEQYRAKYPVFRQVPIVGTMAVEATPRQDRVETIASSALPRVMMGTEDQEFAVLLQTDRLSLGWMRQNPLSSAATYPGFREMKRRFDEELEVFHNWLKNNDFPDVSPDIIELAYNNAFEMGSEEQRRPISDVVTFFQNPRKARMSAFTVTWIELLRPEERVEAELSGSVRVQTGPGIGPDGSDVLLFNMTGSAAVKSGTWSGLDDSFDELHDRIVQIFAGCIQPDAREASSCSQ